jgi:hypothetical protein
MKNHNQDIWCSIQDFNQEPEYKSRVLPLHQPVLLSSLLSLHLTYNEHYPKNTYI